MKQKITSNLSYLLCAAIGLLHFVFLAARYMSAFVKYGGERKVGGGISGYNLMKLGDMSGMGVLGGILQILILIFAIGLLAYGVMGFLKELGVFDQFPDKIANFESKLIAQFALLGYAGLNVLLLLVLLIWSVAATESVGGFKAGITVSFGVFLPLIFGGAAAVAPFLLPKYLPELFENGPQMNYVCTKCGAKAKKTDRFCNTCGGSIAAEVVKKYEYACSQCGKKAQKTDKFCNECGGAVIAREVKQYEYVCGQCGKKLRKTDKFCNVCGGAVMEREAEPVAPAAPAYQQPVAPQPTAPTYQPVAPQPAAPTYQPAPETQNRVCPNCGSPAPAGNKFCNRCGTAL